MHACEEIYLMLSCSCFNYDSVSCLAHFVNQAYIYAGLRMSILLRNDGHLYGDALGNLK